MATGYTHDIEKGMTFIEFALRCSRAFGALIDMRDMPMDAKIPDEIKPSEYHREALVQAKKDLANFNKLKADGFKKKAAQRSAEDLNYKIERLQKELALREKYDKMLSDINEWIPPTPDHVNYHNFMKEQVTSSIEWDCSDKSIAECREAIDNFKPITPAQFKSVERNALKWNVAYHAKEWKKEVEGCKKATKWLRALKLSLSKHAQLHP